MQTKIVKTDEREVDIQAAAAVVAAVVAA